MSAAVMTRPVHADTDELREGRGFPFSMVGDFVVLSGVSARAKEVYWLLRGHVNTARGDDRAWPGMRGLAEVMGLSKIDTVIGAVRELAAIGAVDVETVPTATGRRNVYTVHLAPPPGYTGLASFQELYEQRRRDAARAVAEAAADAPAGPAPPAVRASRACPATRRADRHGSVSAVHGGSSDFSDHPFGGSSDFSDDGSSEKSDLNETKVNQTKGGRARARANRSAPERAGHRDAPSPNSRPETRPDTAPTRPGTQPPDPAPPADLGPGAALVSELGAVTAALAQVAAQLTTALATQPTAAPLPTPTPAAAPDPTPAATPAVPAVLPAIADAPDPARPETWKCARHLAAPDPHDRPCGGCGAVRKHHEALRDLHVAQAAQKRSETAQRARDERAACTDCDDYGHVIDPDTGQVYDHPLRCAHDGPATERIARHRERLAAAAAKTAQTAQQAPNLTGRTAVLDHLAELAARRTHQRDTTPERPLPPTPKAWRH